MSHLTLFTTVLLASLSLATATVANPKRGLVYVESPDPEVNSIWVRDGSPLTWYYNYMWNASEALAAQTDHLDFEFVPMMWGGADTDDTSFLTNVTGLIQEGHKIQHVLGFNHPDASWANGDSNVTPADAARLWVGNFVPLREKGVKIGLPVVQMHANPANWTMPFLANCSALLKQQSGEAKDCPFDFVPIHAYGNMSNFTARIEQFAEAFPGKPIWVTEYAADNQDLNSTQSFFNQSLKYLDASDAVERYAYFGAFRSDVSNVGPNVAMLDPYNRLTDIGSWYLGGNATGNPPVYASGSGQYGGGSGESGSACNATHPCGKDKNSGRQLAVVRLQWQLMAGLLVLM